jgi:hypothetical protein
MSAALKENWMPLMLAALMGTSAGGGVSTAILGEHEHPEIIKEIREVQYDGEIYKLTTQLESMEQQGLKDTPGYKVAEAQLIKFTTMRTELGQ